MRTVLVLGLLSLTGALLRAEVERLDAAPTINFNGMVWYEPKGNGTGIWIDGDVSSTHRAKMGYIQSKPLIGPQQIKWNNQFYDLTLVGRKPDGTLIIQFPGHLLFLTPLEDKTWEGTYSTEGAIEYPRLFRTSTRGLPASAIHPGASQQ